VYLFHLHKPSAFVSLSFVGIGVLVYALSIFISIFDDFSPFRTLTSRAVDVHASPEDATLSRHLVPVLNKVWIVTHHQYDPFQVSNLFKSILPYLDDLKIRLLGRWQPSWSFDATNFSAKEVRCLAYGVCMQWYNTENVPFMGTLKAVFEILNRCSDPWSHLIASLLQVRLNNATWDSQKSPIADCEADLLYTISNVGKFTADRWCFSLSSISTLFARTKGLCGPEEIPAVMRVLARLLQIGLHHEEAVYPGTPKVIVNEYVDFWLYVVMSVLDEQTPCAEVRASAEAEGMLHARDIEACAGGMTSSPYYTRYLLQLSHDHNMDPSLMRGCLVSILYIIVSLYRKGQQEIGLVNQYREIIEEEMDFNAWNISFAELVTSAHVESDEMSATVLCLLRGEWVDLLDDKVTLAARILREYDHQLSETNSRLTTPILKVMDRALDQVVLDRTRIVQLKLQNPWLALYAHNRTRLPYNSVVPKEWDPDCLSIASDRLDLYDRFDCLAESDLVIFFLSCPSAPIAYRALHWYLDIKRNDPTSSDIHDFISFPTIFCRGHSVEENRKSWLLLVEELVPLWQKASSEWRADFVKAFFGDKMTADSWGDAYEETLLEPLDIGELSTTPTKADGLGWMEGVWTTVLRPLVHEVHNWPGLSGVRQATYPESTEPKELTSLLGPSTSGVWEEAPEGIHQDGASSVHNLTEERLKDPARDFLGVLAPLLEAGADLIPGLIDRFRSSVVLLDEHLHCDTESLRRINALLNRNQEG